MRQIIRCQQLSLWVLKMKGISNELLRVANHLAKIPMAGKIESLNVSVAAGVILYEAVRQTA